MIKITSWNVNEQEFNLENFNDIDDIGENEIILLQEVNLELLNKYFDINKEKYNNCLNDIIYYSIYRDYNNKSIMGIYQESYKEYKKNNVIHLESINHGEAIIFNKKNITNFLKSHPTYFNECLNPNNTILLGIRSTPWII